MTTQQSADADRIPATLITGFLGSGKTTLLNHLLRDPAMRDTAVIVNEFGAVGIDHLLIETAFEDAVLLKSGCICCTTRGDLVDTLGDLWARRERGAIPRFERVAIETTGLADPAPILQMLMAEPAVAERYRLERVVTTVDAANALEQLEQQYESAKQAALADLLVLTKTDLASPERQRSVRARLRALNPEAPMLAALHGKLDADRLLGAATTARASAVPPPHPHDHDHDHGDDPCGTEAAHAHLHAIRSTEITADQPIAWEKLARWLEALASLRGPDLLRVKGIVQAAGRERPVVLHAVQHVLHEARELPAWPAGRRETRLVLITRGIPDDALRASFQRAVGAA